jgi:hypothetical protein
MTVARTTAALIGTSESSLATVANNTTTTSSETDMFGNNVSEGWVFVYLVITSTVAVGSLDEEFYPSRVPGQAYSSLATLVGSFAPTNGTQMILVNQVQCARYMTGSVFNNATGANASIFYGYELYQES